MACDWPIVIEDGHLMATKHRLLRPAVI